MSFDELLSVNGGCGGAGTSSSSSSSSGCGSAPGIGLGPSQQQNYGGGSVVGTCGGKVVFYMNQRSFSDMYSNQFGNNACAATSLLNELSEQYTKQTGKTLTESQARKAMEAAVNAGGVNKKNAYVSWNDAANAMAKSLNLLGSYSFTTDKKQADTIIYGLDKNNNGEVDHFVSDIGNGKYYDPYNGTVGNISDFQKNNWNVQTRYMNYELQK